MLITRRLEFECPNKVHRDTYGKQLTLEQARLVETTNCWADATRHQLD